MPTIEDSPTKQIDKTTKASGCCGGHDGEDSKQHPAASRPADKSKETQDGKPEHEHHNKGGSSGCCCSTEPRK